MADEDGFLSGETLDFIFDDFDIDELDEQLEEDFAQAIDEVICLTFSVILLEKSVVKAVIKLATHCHISFIFHFALLHINTLWDTLSKQNNLH